MIGTDVFAMNVILAHFYYKNCSFLGCLSESNLVFIFFPRFCRTHLPQICMDIRARFLIPVFGLGLYVKISIIHKLKKGKKKPLLFEKQEGILSFLKRLTIL